MPHLFFTPEGEYLDACENAPSALGQALARERLTPIAIATVYENDRMQLWQLSPTGRIANVTRMVGKAVIDTINEMQRAGEGG